ncbi:MAG: response regulator [Lachnospiraceae bacterium]|nr:response regulator [Butyrivibrio sp.]MCM1342356.1 response regulator [Muribaculaceae bacterium]MCM1410877.1 response regulator [Lachnospiraceae bacterium]
MDQVVWKDSYNIGVDAIDREHKVLFSTVNKLLTLSQNEKKSEWVCREGVKYVKNHTEEHFEHEEAYMKSIQYCDYEIHKRIHDNFRYVTLPALEKELEDTKYAMESIRHFLGVCIGWVVAHTKMEDQAIAGKAMNKWPALPHEQEQDALETTIIQITREMFQLNAKKISGHYAGEDFGKMVCCRFLYRGHGREKQEVTIAFEERLLLKIIRDILNTDYPKVDDMVLNVTRYIVRQLLEKLRESFPTIGLFELEKECLLTREQMIRSIEKEQPACSLLFGTGEGYFTFCVSNVASLDSKNAMEINHQNAMATIKEFLVKDKAEKAERKKKILVVDDSDFMRERIIQLLRADYDMLEADSSVSAIKKIAVNRPHLVLMDYEMPVCDGRQALEMIRSDEDIADIPVMFLTGKGDRESVKKVMSLKPEGYLLKTMPESEIKKIIDDFFVRRDAK